MGFNNPSNPRRGIVVRTSSGEGCLGAGGFPEVGGFDSLEGSVEVGRLTGGGGFHKEGSVEVGGLTVAGGFHKREGLVEVAIVVVLY
jgi:hypothetical protein